MLATRRLLLEERAESHPAGGAKQVRADLALFRGRDKDAVRATRQEAGEIGFAHGQRRATQILAVERQDVEGIELHFVVMLCANAGR